MCLVFLMKKPEVAKLVERWLKRKYSENRRFEISCKIKRSGADCIVKRNDQLIMQVEVKGSKGDIRWISQCMRYFYEEEGVKTYLAVPHDLKACSVEDIRKVMNDNDAKFGLLEVRKNGKIKIVRDAIA